MFFYILAEIVNRLFYLPFSFALTSELFKLSFNVDFYSLLSVWEQTFKKKWVKEMGKEREMEKRVRMSKTWYNPKSPLNFF